uniref:2-methoxy-6-polyprenyl-1,4-benzoquinol methylase, mitochondrial n=1 Tax=Meloidogyne hapla TaxID=6305 RepID=A0A1I8B080_MELHA
MRLCSSKLFTLSHKLEALSTSIRTNTTSTAHFGFEKIKEDEKQQRVKTVFSNVAKKYDLMNDAMSLFIHRLWKDYYVQNLPLTKNCNVIDVAGGTGDIAFRIAERMGLNGKGSVTIVDINENMLEVGKLRVPPNYSTHLNWVTANAESLPFEDNSFDIYTIAFGIRNCTHPEKVLNEAFRVLKPNDLYSFQIIPVIGQLLVGDFNSYKYLVESIRVFPDQRQFSKMVKDSGFKDVTFEELNFGICNIYSGIK